MSATSEVTVEAGSWALSRPIIRRTTALLALFYLASFFIPALCNQREGAVCSNPLRGYLAALGSVAAMRELFHDPEALAKEPLTSLYAATAWAANVPFVVVTLQLLLSTRRRHFRRAFLATTIAAVDAWLLLAVFAPRAGRLLDVLLPGYWLWTITLSLMAVWTFVLDRAALAEG